MKFPRQWTTERTQVSCVRSEEAEVLSSAFNSNSDIAELDPTFHAGDVKEVLGHIEESQRCEALERGFRMRAMRIRCTNDLLGYLHFREGTPKPDVVGLTMFFIRPEFRSNGYGREVADTLLKHLSADPLNRVAWARVYLKNTPALKFWTGLGFTQIVEHKGQRIHIEGEHSNVILERALE